MENYTIYVSKDPATAADLISRYIVGGSISGELLDDYVLQHGESGYCRVMVFEKYYYRVSNRLTLTVAIDNFEGRTRVHCVSGGGEQGFYSALTGLPGQLCQVGLPCAAELHYLTPAKILSKLFLKNP